MSFSTYSRHRRMPFSTPSQVKGEAVTAKTQKDRSHRLPMQKLKERLGFGFPATSNSFVDVVVKTVDTNKRRGIPHNSEAKALGYKMGDPEFKIRDLIRRENVQIFSSN